MCRSPRTWSRYRSISLSGTGLNSRYDWCYHSFFAGRAWRSWSHLTGSCWLSPAPAGTPSRRHRILGLLDQDCLSMGHYLCEQQYLSLILGCRSFWTIGAALFPKTKIACMGLQPEYWTEDLERHRWGIQASQSGLTWFCLWGARHCRRRMAGSRRA